MLAFALMQAPLAAPTCLTALALSGADPGFGPTLPPSAPRSGVVSDTCWGQRAPNRVVVGRFAVEFEDGFDAALAADFGEALNDAYDELVYTLGWTPVHGDDQHLILAYIDPGTGGAAYTTTAACSGSTGWMPYIVATSDAFGDEDWWRDMAAHELNHAQQFSTLAGHEAWWWEATAVWAQEQVHPSHDTWIRYVDSGFSAQPGLAMRGSSQTDPDTFLHMYGMAIWAFYLEEHVERGLVRRTWEEGAGAEAIHPLQQLEALGQDPEELISGFLAANAAMDYSHREDMARVTAIAGHDTLPAEGEDAPGPQSLGQAFVRLPTTGTDANAPNLRVRVEGSGAWTRLLVGVRGGEPSRVLAFDDEAILDAPDSDEELWLAVAPTTESAASFAWSWQVEATDEAGGGGGLVEGPGDREGTGTLPGETGRCSTGGGRGGFGLALLALLRRAIASSRPTPSPPSRG